MQILTISGSSRLDSANRKLLKAISELLKKHDFRFFDIAGLPLFADEVNRKKYPDPVMAWQKELRTSEAIIIATPEYIYNIPAALKNALEWITASGEMSGKRVVPITFSPAPPRGEKAMQSLLWSLQALDAQILPTFSLYQGELIHTDGEVCFDDETENMIRAVFEMIH